jgi:hypothetical protein
MKTDKNYRFPRHYKYMLAQITDPHLRGLWRKSFIEANVAEVEFSKVKVKSKGE